MCGAWVIPLQRSGTWTPGRLWLLGGWSPLLLRLHLLCRGECARSRGPDLQLCLQQFRLHVRISGGRLRSCGVLGILL